MSTPKSQFTDVIDIPIAIDEIVCVICGQSMSGKRWGLISNQHRRGIFMIVCEDDADAAAELLANSVGVERHEGIVKLPPLPNN